MEVFPDFEYDHGGPSEGNTTLQRVSTPLHTSLNLSTPLHTSSHLLTPLHNSHLLSLLFLDHHLNGDIATLDFPVNNVSFNKIMLGINVLATFFKEAFLEL